MSVRVNTTYAKGDLTEEQLLEARRICASTLSNMNDRQFTTWLKASWGASTEFVEVGVVSSQNVLWKFRLLDVEKEISDAIDARMNAPRIKSNMIVVELPEGVRGYNPLTAMTRFMQEFDAYANNGPAEPKLCHFKHENVPVLEKDWLEWYCAIFAVDLNTAWQAGAAKVAKELDRSENDWAWYPAEINNLEIVFVRKLASIRI